MPSLQQFLMILGNYSLDPGQLMRPKTGIFGQSYSRDYPVLHLETLTPDMHMRRFATINAEEFKSVRTIP